MALLACSLPLQAAIWSDATELGDGWQATDWLGFYYESEVAPGWFYHPDFGWLFASEEETGNAHWCYFPEMDVDCGGWLYIDAANWPYYYRLSMYDSGWVDYNTTKENYRLYSLIQPKDVTGLRFKSLGDFYSGDIVLPDFSVIDAFVPYYLLFHSDGSLESYDSDTISIGVYGWINGVFVSDSAIRAQDNAQFNRVAGILYWFDGQKYRFEKEID